MPGVRIGTGTGAVEPKAFPLPNGVQAKAVMVGTGTGAVKVWRSGPPVVAITATQSGQAQSQFRAACTAHGVNYATVQELPFLLDTSQATNLAQMFTDCASLVTVPDLDTSKATTLSFMFWRCSSLIAVPDLITGHIFDLSSMFRNCSSLTDGNVRCIGRLAGASTSGMITGSGLTRLPFYDANGNPI